MPLHSCPDPQRRKFIADIAKLSGSAILVTIPSVLVATESQKASSFTVGEIMDRFIKEVPGAPLAQTVDTLKSGSRDNVVTGIVTTMFPTIEIIRKAAGAKANFIICHEPSYYNHLDETEWLRNDDVFNYKMELINKHGISIWRNHDYIHRHSPDGVLTGLVNKLGWETQFDMAASMMRFDKSQSLKTLITHVKAKLEIPTLRYNGDLSLSCKNILLMPGAYGGRMQISGTSSKKPDVLICGEIAEWETAEYIRDANAKGQKIGLIVLGHAVSEEPGSLYMKEWLNKEFPSVKTVHIPSRNPLSFI